MNMANLRIKNIIIWALLFLILSVIINKKSTNPFKTIHNIYPYYDYIIIGGGTAGCVIASRLSEIRNINILLIEAGDHFNYVANIPIAPTFIQRGPNDWSFTSVPQKFSSFGLKDKIQYLPRGKGLGGTGELNYFLHGVGIPEDYSNWVELGAKSYNYSILKPYIDNIFQKDECTFSNKPFCKENSNDYQPKIKISNVEANLQNLLKIFIKSASQLPDEYKMKPVPLYSTIYKGKRESTYRKYIQPNLERNNLHIIPNTVVKKINFKDKKAYSLEIISQNESREIIALNEIVISAGSIQTPHILMLSGIGPKSQLKKHNINVVHKSNGVGENLHDHLNLPLYITINSSLSITLEKIMSLKTVIDYLWFGKGYISSPGVIAQGRGPKHTSVILFAMGSIDEVILREITNSELDNFKGFFPFYKDKSQEGIIFLCSCLRPMSRGTIKLKDNDFRNLPLIDPNYLSNENDIKCMIQATKLAKEIINTPIFQNINATIHWPKLKECNDLWKIEINDEYLECIIRQGALTGHHAAGTCSMGGPSPVIDENFRVNGVKSLRIVDASIFPGPISSSTNSITIVIAEIAAKIISKTIS